MAIQYTILCLGDLIIFHVIKSANHHVYKFIVPPEPKQPVVLALLLPISSFAPQGPQHGNALPFFRHPSLYYALSEVHHPTGTRRTYPTERTRYLFIRSPGSTATNQQPGLTPPDRPCCGRPFPLSEPAHDTGSRNYQSPWCVGARRLHGRIHIAKDNASNEFHALGRFLSNLYDIAVSYPCTRQRALKSKVLYVRYLR